MILTGCIGVRMIMTIDEAIQDWEDRKAFLQRTCDHCWDEPAEMALQALKEKRSMIRCIDCKFMKVIQCGSGSTFLRCSIQKHSVTAFDYCSWAKIREEKNNESDLSI